MATVAPISSNTTARQPKWLTLLRVLLGITVVWKGYHFFRDIVVLESIIKEGGLPLFSKNNQIISFGITYFNLLGGFFITVGLFTRWMCVLQIFIMIGAAIYISTVVRTGYGMYSTPIELLLFIMVLALSILFTIKGSGSLSADEYFANYTKAGIERGHTKNFLK